MAAEEHLSPDQFEIVHPHRMVKIAGHPYPAAMTYEPEHIPGMVGASIPMENGRIVEIHHFGDVPNEFDIGHFISPSHEENAHLTNIATVQGAEKAHEVLQGLAKSQVPERAREYHANRLRILRDRIKSGWL